jgi:hypothetical protein
MLAGASALTNSLIFVMLSLSLIHGWASSGMFCRRGAFRGSFGSRLRVLMGSVNKFYWRRVLLGSILLVNTSVPPFPSFFPELLIISRGLTASFFVLFALFFINLAVCYYNAFLYILISQFRNLEAVVLGSSFSFKEGATIIKLLILTFFSLCLVMMF